MNDFGKIRTLIIELSQLGVLDQRKILALLWQVTAEERQCDKVSSMVDELEGLVLPLAIAAAVGDQDTLNERKAHSLELINRLQVKCGFNNAA